MPQRVANWRVLLAVAAVALLVAVALWPEAVPVEVASAARGPMVVTIDEEGQTRVRQRFVVSAPVAGRVLRIELEPGDRIDRGQVVARIQPAPAPLLDARMRAEAEAMMAAARAAGDRARAEQERARAALLHAERELARSRTLVDAGALPAQEADARASEERLARQSLNAADSAVRSADAELARARAVLAAPSGAGSGVVTVTAPAAGVILRRLRESESVVAPGEPLVELGDPAQLEIVADLLSTDAVRVRPGARATVEQWGIAAALEAVVRRIEPAGFTKVSALGVEEQRVNVILDLVDPAAEDAPLGDAYRVEVRIVLWEADDVLKVPTSALFRDGERWAVYTVDEDRARLTHVEVGQQTGREAEIVGGVSEGTIVIVHPGDAVADGTRVRIETP